MLSSYEIVENEAIYRLASEHYDLENDCHTCCFEDCLAAYVASADDLQVLVLDHPDDVYYLAWEFAEQVSRYGLRSYC